jgi:HEAT repeat protein
MQDRSPQVRRFLGEIGTNPNAKYRTRCFAAFALGLLGDREAAAGANADAFNVLKSMVTAGEASKDISCSALVGIGLLGDRVAIPDLLQWLTEEKAGSQKLNDVQLSYVAAALGKIGAPGTGGPDTRDVLDALRQQLTRKNRMTRWSAVVAFGQIAPNASETLQKQCVSDLSQVIDSEGKATSDPQTVNFALTSLGRIAGAAGVSDATRRKAVERLVSSFDGKATTRSFASLGLGIAGPMMDKEEKSDVCERIRNTLAKSSGDVEQRGAMVIGLGLLKDIKSGSVLLGLLQDRGLDKALRGTAAVALGLIGDSSAVEPVRSALKEKDDQKLRVDAAIAAGLLRDTEAVQILVGILQDPKSSQFILGSVSTALGQIGDQRAVEPLAQILRDDKAQYPDLTRALACVALGQVGDKSDLSVLSRLSRDVNYRAYYEAIGEVLTIL